LFQPIKIEPRLRDEFLDAADIEITELRRERQNLFARVLLVVTLHERDRNRVDKESVLA